MSVAAPDELDQPIRRAMPELARGAAALGRLGISTARQALWYLPFRYDDFSELRPLGELVPDEKQSARVTCRRSAWSPDSAASRSGWSPSSPTTPAAPRRSGSAGGSSSGGSSRATR